VGCRRGKRVEVQELGLQRDERGKGWRGCRWVLWRERRC
jgi:hypothetical protein